MAENKVSVEISLEEKAVLAGLTKIVNQVNKTEDSFTKMSKTADKELGVMGELTKGVSGGFKSLVGGVTIANLASEAIIGTANAIKSFVLGSINAAVEQENAINRLNQALRASGSFTEEASEDFLNFASAMQRISVFGDEVIIGQLAVAKSFGATNQQAKDLVQAAANLSATFGGSLESNVEKLGKTFSGSADRLAKYIPELKKLTEEQLKSGQAFEIVNAKFSGAAANELKTYSGQVTALGNAYSDLQEELGGLVTNSNFVKTATSGLTNVFQRLIEQIQTSRIETEANKKTFVDSESKVNVLSEQYALLTARLEKYQQIAQGGIGFDLRTVNDAKTEVKSLTAQLDKLQYQINQSTRRISEASASNPAPTTNPSLKNSSPISESDQKLIDSRNAAYLALQQSYVENAAWEAEQDLMKRQITDENFALELEQLQGIEQAKIDAKFAAEEQRIMATNKGVTEELLLEKTRADKALAIQKANVDAEKRLKEKQLADDAMINNTRLSSLGNFLGAAMALSKQGSKEQQALSIANALVSTYQAAANALTLKPTIPLGVSAAALVTAQGLAQVRNITAQKFNYGGIVNGNSITGDTIPARVNSGEMILNRQQQTELFKIANGSNNESSLKESLDRLTSAIMSQPITISVDGRKIAESVRSQVQGGFRLA